MIQPNRLLESLFYIATRYQEFAIFWHLVIYLLLFFIIKQRRLPVVSLSLMIALLFFSVSAFAWQVKNPFNLAAFIMLGVSLIAASISLKRGSITFSSLQFSTITGIVSLLAGLFYPHFFWKRLDQIFICSTGGVNSLSNIACGRRDRPNFYAKLTCLVVDNITRF